MCSTIDNPFDTGTFTSRILLKLCEIPCAMFRRSVQKQGLLHNMAEIHELLRAEKYETVENHNVKIIGYIHPGGMDSYKKLCAAIKDLKYEALYTEMIVLLPVHRQSRDGKCEIVCSCFVCVCVCVRVCVCVCVCVWPCMSASTM